MCRVLCLKKQSSRRSRPHLVGVGRHFPRPALCHSGTARGERLVADGNVSLGLSDVCGPGYAVFYNQILKSADPVTCVVSTGGFLSISFSFMVGDLNYLQEETLLPSIVGTLCAVVAASVRTSINSQQFCCVVSLKAVLMQRVSSLAYHYDGCCCGARRSQ